MLSQPIDIQKKELKEPIRQEQSKRPAPYPQERKRSSFSQELEEGSLTALKQLLTKEKKEDEDQQVIVPTTPFLPPQQIAASSTALTKIDPSSQVMGLYEKLIESIVTVHDQGVRETTFFLDGDAFSASIFQGAKITITEYSTAPKVFNVQFSAHSQAVNFFESHAADLLIALQKEHFGFSVNRLDTSLMSEDEKHIISKVERDLEKEEDA